MGNKERCPVLRIIQDYKGIPFSHTALTHLAESVYRGEKIPAAQTTNLILCSDYKIRKLNRIYRGKDSVTDVLSFTFNEPDLLGEIYISLQRVRVQAPRYGFSFEEELFRLFVHGMFHLLGYEHRFAQQSRKMQHKERKYVHI